MCNCIQEMSEKALTRIKAKYPKAIKVDFDDVVFGFEGGKMSRYMAATMSITFIDKKRPKKMPFAYASCPFCGESYDNVGVEDPEDILP